MGVNAQESSPLLGTTQPIRSFDHLPRWFLVSSIGAVVFSLLWMVGLVILQHSPHFHPSVLLDDTPFCGLQANLYLYAGILNSLLGSFLSASGYCCQKWAHHRVQSNPSLGTVSQQPLFVFGLFLLAVGTISAVLNLGILGQAVQAPFAAFTLVYSALLGHFVLEESFELYDVLSSLLIVIGVGVDVWAAQVANIPQQTYTLSSLGGLFFRDSIFPALYAASALFYTIIILGQVHGQGLHHRALGLLAFSSCAGIMAGFTSLATKSTVEVVKSALISSPPHGWEMLMNPLFVLLIACIPSALIPQLFFLNKGLEHFGTLQFIPLYQAFVILGNLTCGMIFYNEMALYSVQAIRWFVGGIVLTLAGVCLRLIKVERRPTPLPTQRTTTAFATTFRFEDIEWAQGPQVHALMDFNECKQQIVELLESATDSIYYSTFLCDFTQPLDPNRVNCTFLSCLQAAVERGVEVHILYNPIVDYGTPSVAHLKAQLPSGVLLSCCTSDLGPSFVTRMCSNNSKYAFHHQKYLCVDGTRIMVTGCDVNMERQGWLEKNALGYYWHELSVVTSCSRPMFDWIRQNHMSHEKKRHYDSFHESPPFPLVAGGWREENAMILMILHARTSIQLENQILISGGSIQHNRICAAIVERIARAEEEGPNHGFRVLVLTNAAQQDEPSALTRAYCTISIQWSLEQLELAAIARGLTLQALYHALFIARMETSDGILVKVHSNILITDGWYALRSSSNLADRSLSSRPCDTELGLLLKGDVVHTLHQKLLNRYMGTQDVVYESLETIIRAAQRRRWTRQSRCCLVPIEKRDWNPVMTWFLMHLFVFMSEGATGGRLPVTYQVTTTTIGTSDKDNLVENRKEANAF